MPKTLGEVKQILGMFNFLQKNIKDYSKIIKPVHEKLKGFTSTADENTNIDIGEKEIEEINKVKKKYCHLDLYWHIQIGKT